MIHVRLSFLSRMISAFDELFSETKSAKKLSKDTVAYITPLPGPCSSTNKASFQ